MRSCKIDWHINRFAALLLVHGVIACGASAQSRLTVQVPTNPTAETQCRDLEQEFFRLLRQVRDEQSQCMQGMVSGTRPCVRMLELEWDRISSEKDSEVRGCYEKVRAYLDQKRREDEEQRRFEAERRAREEAQVRAREERALEQRQEASRQEERRKEARSSLEMALELKKAEGARKIVTATNPFDAAMNAAADKATDSVGSNLFDAATESQLPSSSEVHDRAFDATAKVVDQARYSGLGDNPFARKISGQSLNGITSLDRRALGQFDNAVDSTKDLGVANPAPSNNSTQTFRPTPIAGGTAPDSGSTLPATNPFGGPPPSEIFYDPATDSTIDIPSGYVLYRDPGTTKLAAVSPTQLPQKTSGWDDPDLGDKGCSDTGMGLVTPVCERKRQAKVNPFLPK